MNIKSRLLWISIYKNLLKKRLKNMQQETFRNILSINSFIIFKQNDSYVQNFLHVLRINNVTDFITKWHGLSLRQFAGLNSFHGLWQTVGIWQPWVGLDKYSKIKLQTSAKGERVYRSNLSTGQKRKFVKQLVWVLAISAKLQFGIFHWA